MHASTTVWKEYDEDTLLTVSDLATMSCLYFDMLLYCADSYRVSTSYNQAVWVNKSVHCPRSPLSLGNQPLKTKEKEGKERKRKGNKQVTHVFPMRFQYIRLAGDSPSKCTTSFTSTRSYSGAAAAADVLSASPCAFCSSILHDVGQIAPAAVPSSDVNSTKSTAEEVNRETFSASEFLYVVV